MKDEKIICDGCQTEFFWTVEDQLYFEKMGLKYPPKRCKKCKVKQRKRSEAVKEIENSRGQKNYQVKCDRCHVETTLPFYPFYNKEILCRQCFKTDQATHKVKLVSGVECH